MTSAFASGTCTPFPTVLPAAAHPSPLVRRDHGLLQLRTHHPAHLQAGHRSAWRAHRARHSALICRVSLSCSQQSQHGRLSAQALQIFVAAMPVHMLTVRKLTEHGAGLLLASL